MKKNFTFMKLVLLIGVLFGSLNVHGQYNGTGVFTKITSTAELSDGYYVIAYGTTFAMNSANSGSYFSHTGITVASSSITNPATSIVWKIETNGTGKSIYNEASQKYVSYTGSANAAQAVDAVAGNNQLWSFSIAGTLFSVKNLAVQTRFLQHNGSATRFACYTGTQNNLTLYKLATPVQNDVATLSSLLIDGTAVTDFDPATLEYNHEVAYSETNIPEVTATATASGAMMQITQATTLPGSATVYVLAEDGVTEHTYTINFTKAAASADATLSSLMVGGTAVTGFDPATLIYTHEVGYSETVIPVVTATTTTSGAMMEITQATTLPGSATVYVLAEDGVTEHTYTINFTKATANTDATLSNLMVGGTAVAGFDPETLEYTFNVRTGTLVEAFPAITYTLNNLHTNATQTSATGVGIDNAATVVTLAEDGVTTLTYKLVFGYTDINDGSKEAPFTVAEAKVNQGVLGSNWVVAYIVGNPVNSPPVLGGTGKTAIAIADTKEELVNFIPVAVNAVTSVQNALNLQANPTNLGRKVKLYGTLESYFGVPGMKNVTNYEFFTPTFTPVGIVDNKITFGTFAPGAAKSDLSFVIDTQDLTDAVEYTITGDDAAQFAVASSTQARSVLAAQETMTVTYTPTATEAIHSATLTISSLGATSVVVALSGETKVTTGLSTEQAEKHNVYAVDGVIYVKLNTEVLTSIEVFNTLGLKVASELATKEALIPVAKGQVYIVKAGNNVAKVVVQ